MDLPEIMQCFPNGETKRFKALSTLGKGTFCVCYEVLGTESHKKYACKIVNSAKYFYTAEREQKMLKVLNHKNIIKIVDYFANSNSCNIIMEICEQGNICDYLDEHSLSDFMCRRLIFQAFQAVNYIQEMGVIHRDIKPENFFISSDHGVKLGDFGLAIYAKDAAEFEGVICGTIGYTSPEIASFETFGLESDIWSFGCVVYFILALTDLVLKRIKGRTVYVMPKNVGDKGSDLIKKLIQVNPKDRLTPKQIKAHPYFEGMSGYESWHECIENMENCKRTGDRPVVKRCISECLPQLANDFKRNSCVFGYKPTLRAYGCQFPCFNAELCRKYHENLKYEEETQVQKVEFVPFDWDVPSFCLIICEPITSFTSSSFHCSASSNITPLGRCTYEISHNVNVCEEDLILRTKPAERLTREQIKSHSYFKSGTKWHAEFDELEEEDPVKDDLVELRDFQRNCKTEGDYKDTVCDEQIDILKSDDRTEQTDCYYDQDIEIYFSRETPFNCLYTPLTESSPDDSDSD